MAPSQAGFTLDFNESVMTANSISDRKRQLGIFLSSFARFKTNTPNSVVYR